MISELALDPPPAISRFRSGEELAMRGLVEAELRRMRPTARVVHEFSLRYSTNRIDLAAITHDEIVGVEIKSSRDVTDRLEAQLRGFGPVCSRLVVALAPRWNVRLPMQPEAATRRRAAGLVSAYTETQAIIRKCAASAVIETWTVDAMAGLIDKTDGQYQQNDTPHPRKLLELLHVAELTEIAARRRVGARPVHFDLVQACFELMTSREIMADVCQALRARAAFAAQSDRPVGGGSSS